MKTQGEARSFLSLPEIEAAIKSVASTSFDRKLRKIARNRLMTEVEKERQADKAEEASLALMRTVMAGTALAYVDGGDSAARDYLTLALSTISLIGRAD